MCLSCMISSEENRKHILKTGSKQTAGIGLGLDEVLTNGVSKIWKDQRRTRHDKDKGLVSRFQYDNNQDFEFNFFY